MSILFQHNINPTIKIIGSIIFCSTIIFLGCDTKKKDQQTQNMESASEASPSIDLKNRMIGKWVNVSLHVHMNSYNNSETDSTMLAEEGQWENILKIKPIETTYLENGTFRSVYIGLNDSIVGETSGQWEINEDSLILTIDGIRIAYKTELNNNRTTFTGFLDFDSDGQSDDLYSGIQEKVE
ncbi:hypothetical protein QQ008_01800 [Fulvivirgaceae bacterium BMA10]|uniref:Lipocalin-like domain-containing protein n=1 Tax=Splendidivirga corallicola TaxID=3051826 RepID=A0ABT8KH73_9BACT|nr:hypothetical protein [Fulvivirgaceae bacterium BMA10]